MITIQSQEKNFINSIPLPAGKSKYKTFKIGKVFFLFYEKGCFWFRLFGGYGFAGKNMKYNWLVLFSERNGYRKVYKLLGWKWEVLTPTKKPH